MLTKSFDAATPGNFVITLTITDNVIRYFRLLLLTLSAGALYPLLYLRQNYEVTLLQAFSMNADELGQCYTILGLAYVFTYVPSGWLADRFHVRGLVVFSLCVVGALGLWFASYPDKAWLPAIFLGWGIAGGLTFWSAILKGVKLLATAREQGRFFGILDGGRGLVEALLASIAIGVFALYAGSEPQIALRPVILMYAGSCLGIAVLAFLGLGKRKHTAAQATASKRHFWQDFWLLLGIPEIWLMSFIVMAGYQLLWATFYFSTYLEHHFQQTAVMAGALTTIKLWMRPIGAIGGGWLGDRFSNIDVLGWGMLIAALAWFGFILVPADAAVPLIIGCIVVLGLFTYAIHGLYWAILDRCHVPDRMTGLALGIVSMIGLSPDIFLPMISSALSKAYPGVLGTQLYFLYITVCCLIGSGLAFWFKRRTVDYRFRTA